MFLNGYPSWWYRTLIGLLYHMLWKTHRTVTSLSEEEEPECHNPGNAEKPAALVEPGSPGKQEMKDSQMQIQIRKVDSLLPVFKNDGKSPVACTKKECPYFILG